MTGAPDRNILLAYDFGLRRIGVATGNLLTATAAPLVTLRVGSDLPWAQLDSLILEWNPGQLVVGLPDPERAGEISRKAESFANELGRRYDLPVARIDEAFTSRAAQSMLRERRESGIMKRKVSRGHVDSQAACLIAEQWMSTKLDEDATGPPLGRDPGGKVFEPRDS